MNEKMKEAFKRCMKQLYPKQIPEQRQLSDLARVFVMGWIECSSNCLSEQLALHQGDVESIKCMIDVGWKADQSFHWDTTSL